MALPISRINPIRAGGPDRPHRHLHDRLRPARPRLLRPPAAAAWHKVKAFPQQHRAAGRRRPSAAAGRPRRRRRHRPARHHGRHPLRPRASCPTAATSRGSPTTASATSSRASRTSASDSQDTPFVRYVNRWRLERADGSPGRRAQALAAQEADRLLDREDGPARVPGVRPGGHPGVEQGVREDRLPRRHRGAPAGGRGLRPRGHQLQHVPLDHQRTRASPWGRRGPTR